MVGLSVRGLSVRLALAIALLAGAGMARAGIVLSQAVIDIVPGAPIAQDVEVWNDGNEVSYVVAEPSEIIAPGLAAEHRARIEDPGVGGLLVTPQRLILQPGERKLLRIAAVAPRAAADRIYRVTVKPVTGAVSAQTSALKLLVGYDMLVIYRPEAPDGTIVGSRNGKTLTLRNAGNTNVEIYDGTQCPAPKTGCQPLPARRLYAGETWQQTLPGSGTVEYRIAVGRQSSVQQF